jgi:hypothetical protein
VVLPLQIGWPNTVMKAFAADMNQFVEPLDGRSDIGGWTPTNSVATSNHLGGTAMDLAWNNHPFHVVGTYNAEQQATIRALLDFYEGNIYWGGDWTDPIDEMHYQMGYGTYNNPAVPDFINRKISPNGFSTFDPWEAFMATNQEKLDGIADPDWGELRKRFPSRSMYRTTNDLQDTLAGFVLSANAFVWDNRVEACAERGEQWAVDLVKACATGTGIGVLRADGTPDQFLVDHAKAVLAKVPKT